MMALALGLAVTVSGQAASVDVKLPAYKKVSGVSGTLNSVGSDTLNNMMALWAESFQALYPNVKIQIEGKGSSTAPPALIEGSSQMKATEIDAFEKKFGYKPSAVGVAIDALAVFVHKDNPVKSLSLPQLKAIWGEGGSIENWKDVGGPDAKIELFGRSNSSGTHAFYKKAVLGKGVEFKLGTASSAGSTAVVDTCATTLTAIGYSGMSYKTDAVGWLAISKADGEEAFEPSIPNVASGKYPIARPLYIHTVGEPSGHVKEYIDWIKSGGQASLTEQGFVPLSVE